MRSLLSLAFLSYVAAQKVATGYGYIIGNAANNVESFRGIPYAHPPTTTGPFGNLRLKPPKPWQLFYNNDLYDNASTAACPQFVFQNNANTFSQNITDQLEKLPIFTAARAALNQRESEDCLTLDVQRPAGTTKTSKLPVLVWIYGGGFQIGATNMYDATNFINKGTSLNKKFIYVAMNYRVNGFGFLGGADLKNDGSTNLGLRDQRAALQWVQDRIAEFGGDPDNVTLFGESAGAISVLDHLIINNGNHNGANGKPLFHGVIMNSGSVAPASNVDSFKPQVIYNLVSQALNCGDLNCIRNKPYAQLRDAIRSVPSAFGQRSLDLSYLPRPDPSDTFFAKSPEQAIIDGTYAKVPVIIGDVEDEGTIFTLFQGTSVYDDRSLKDYIRSYFQLAPSYLIESFVDEYKIDQDENQFGSPFRNTANSGFFGKITKKFSAIIGDGAFNLQRRAFLERAASKVACWSYLGTYGYPNPFIGTYHSSDTNEVFNTNPPPNSGTRISNWQTYYINFITGTGSSKSPNGANIANNFWQQYTTSNKWLLDIQVTGGYASRIDDFRANPYNILSFNWNYFRI